MNPSVTFAFFKRNFVGYFSNPTGYVFIGVFVLLSGIAAFWPNEFFTNNLANLSLLNQYIPWILLLFIPAITMGAWAEERRLGTDELVLTLPSSDLDVVLGKYFSLVAIYTVALIFSAVSNLIVLSQLGNPDWWLLTANYLGYWFIGLSMLAIGMVASFLTRNLTVAFILGVILNSPLVLAEYADVIFREPWVARLLSNFSVAEQFRDFSTGVLTLGGVFYFLSVVIVMLYLCMVLIARRHWVGSTHAYKAQGGDLVLDFIPAGFVWTVLAAGFVGLVYLFTTEIWSDDGFTRGEVVELLTYSLSYVVALTIAAWFLNQGGEHYLIRICSLGVILTGITVVGYYVQPGISVVPGVRLPPIQVDMTADKLNSLSPETIALLEGFDLTEGSVVDSEDITHKQFPASNSLLQQPQLYSGCTLEFTSGDLKGERAQVVSYSGEDRILTLDRTLPKKPAAGDEFTLERPRVKIDAFISPDVPEEFVQHRLNLISLLRRIDAMGGQHVELRIRDTEIASDQAEVAENEFGITPEFVVTQKRGVASSEEIFMGAAISCGLEKVVIPFFHTGVPVEYELMRSIATVSQQKRKKLGVVQTDVNLLGGFDPQAMMSGGTGTIPKHPFIEELEKQYEVVGVDLNEPVAEDIDVLLAVQPSGLTQEKMDLFLAAIRSGTPTAIFEDPFPLPNLFRGVTGTSEPRRPSNPMMGQFNRNQQPKADIKQLFDLLQLKLAEVPGILSNDFQIIFHTYNPEREFQTDPSFVWAGLGSQTDEPFNPDSNVVSALTKVLYLMPGAIRENTTTLELTPLVRTGLNSGYYKESDLRSRQATMVRNETGEEYVLAAHIRGKPSQASADEEKQQADNQAELNVIFVPDIDLMAAPLFRFWQQGENEQMNITFSTDNVTFLLNIVDKLGGEERFISVRNRQRSHRLLTELEKVTSEVENRKFADIAEFRQALETLQEELEAEIQEQVEEIQNDDSLTRVEKRQKLAEMQQQRAREMAQRLDKEREELEDKIRRREREAERAIRERQTRYKLLAVSLPPIPLLLLALIVYVVRRLRETEGVSASRLR